MELALGEHIGLIGRTWAGKTQRFRRTIEPVFPRVLVTDTEYDVKNYESYDFNDLQRVGGDGMHVAKAIRGLDNKAFKWRWNPPPDIEEESVELLSQGLLNHCERMLAYFDEVTDWSDAHRIGDWFRKLVRKGRKRQITVVWGSQRPAGVNHWLLSNTAHLFVMFLNDDELEIVENYFSRETVELFRRLHYGRTDGIWDFYYRDPKGTWTYFRG